MKMRTLFFGLAAMLTMALPVFAARAKRDDSCCSDLKKGITCLKKELKKHGKPTCCDSEPITQKKMNRARGLLILDKSGNYALTEDVTGTIVLAVDSICLDLCCHTLSAGNKPNAIIANGLKALEVFNGQITQSRDAGILMTNCASVDIYDLTMRNHKLDACRFTDTSALAVNDVNFLQNNSGERAFFFTSCDNVSVSDCVATGFLSTIGAVVQFESSTDISMQDVNVTDCTKTLAAPSGDFPGGFFNPAVRLVSLANCFDFDLTRVRVNNNTSNSDQVTNAFEALGVGSSANGSFNQCEANNNITINGGNPGVFELLAISCNNIFLNNNQINNNRCEGPNNFFFGAGALFSSGIIIDGCQANNNFISEFSVTPGLLAGAWGMGCTLGKNNAIRNSQACNNRVENPGIRPSWSGVGLLEVFILDENGVFDQCQALNNSMGTSNAFTAVIGLNQEGAIGVESNCGTISNSNFSNNNGGEIAIGLLINTTIFDQPLFPSSVNISNCTMNSNESYGILVGFPPVNPIAGSVKGVQIIDCTLNNNGRESSGDTAGIYFLQSVIPVTDILIKGCVINGTFASNGNAVGINIPHASNVVIEDTIVNNTTADGFGHGILFDTVVDSKILRTQLHENQNSGVELVGTNANVALIECVVLDNDIGFDFAPNSSASCCLVQDCKAIRNRTAGFFHAPTPLTTTFIGNEAQCNGASAADNFVIASGVINLQQLTWGTGTYSQITGTGATLGSSRANLRVVP